MHIYKDKSDQDLIKTYRLVRKKDEILTVDCDEAMPVREACTPSYGNTWL